MRTGFVSGLLLALSPGVGVFSNLLLAHHPTLLGLSSFLFAFVRLMNSRSLGWAFAAGCGLSFAMLARPMTAAGFALPFGVWLVAVTVSSILSRVSGRVASDDRANSHLGWKPLVAVAMPLVAGLAIMFFYNRSITGNGLEMPYQQYTDIYTPKHVFGFYNVTRGSQAEAPKRIVGYDDWAEELTPQLAASQRLRASGRQWSMDVRAAPGGRGRCGDVMRTSASDMASASDFRVARVTACGARALLVRRHHALALCLRDGSATCPVRRLGCGAPPCSVESGRALGDAGLANGIFDSRIVADSDRCRPLLADIAANDRGQQPHIRSRSLRGFSLTDGPNDSCRRSSGHRDC